MGARNDEDIHISGWHVEYSLVQLNLHESIPRKYDKITKNSSNMVVNMYVIGPKKDQLKPVFFWSFWFFQKKSPRPRLQKTNKWSFLVLVFFDLGPVQLQSFASPRTGLSNTTYGFVKTRSTLELTLEYPEISVRWDLASVTQRGVLCPCQVLSQILECEDNLEVITWHCIAMKLSESKTLAKD